VRGGECIARLQALIAIARKFCSAGLLGFVLLVLPRPETGTAGSCGHLPGNLQHVPKAVVMKAAHGREVVGEGVTMSGLQLLNQELDVGDD
jgi:hypothetical protein